MPDPHRKLPTQPGSPPDSDPRSEDIALLLRVAQQDKSAFAELFGRYAGRVKSFLLRYAMPDDQAEEIAQEVMVQVWRKASSYDPAKAAPSTWIFAIARNRRIDLIRRSARRQPDPDDPMFQPDPEPDGGSAVSAMERQTQVREALATLPDNQRTVLFATFFEGLSQVEIAEREGVPLGTVKSRVRLAFARMRDRLGPDMIQELYDD